MKRKSTNATPRQLKNEPGRAPNAALHKPGACDENLSAVAGHAGSTYSPIIASDTPCNPGNAKMPKGTPLGKKAHSMKSDEGENSYGSPAIGY